MWRFELVTAVLWLIMVVLVRGRSILGWMRDWEERW